MIVFATFIITRGGVDISLDIEGEVTRDSVTVQEVFYPNTSRRWDGELTDTELGDAQDALREEAGWL